MMNLTLAEKIIAGHLVSGRLEPGEEIGIRVDQTLTQDATGTLACLEFESLGLQRVKTRLSVSYVDHNTLQTSFENADDHRYLQTFAARHGIYFSKPGNGICHQVHLERFGRAGEVLLGSDSHTPTAGGLAQLAVGVGGLEIAAAMAGHPYFFRMPEVFEIRLLGRLPRWVSAKDVILHVLSSLTVQGGRGKILEYTGSGIKRLSIPERATIANMGAETGATTSIFPSDETTREFLRSQEREEDFTALGADSGANYAGTLKVKLSSLVPLVAGPDSPDKVRPASELEGLKIDQVCIGSCTNSSLKDLLTARAILKGKRVHPSVSLVISPGSRQVLNMAAARGVLFDLVTAGARILETACGPCIGMGQAPPSGGVSLRTYNRNFPGRSGTADADVYLVSPEVAAASALKGEITDPRHLGPAPRLHLPSRAWINDSLIIPPSEEPEKVEVIKGPNISSVPLGEPLPESLSAAVWIKTGDNVTTDAIMPAGAKVLPLRSNLEKISRFVFHSLDPDFARRAERERAAGRWGIIVGGENYGQGSSREHAALAPRYLGVRVVVAASFARIHRSNLINFGIPPLVFSDPSDAKSWESGTEFDFPRLREEVAAGKPVIARPWGGGKEWALKLVATPREKEILLRGGLLALLSGS